MANNSLPNAEDLAKTVGQMAGQMNEILAKLNQNSRTSKSTANAETKGKSETSSKRKKKKPNQDKDPKKALAKAREAEAIRKENTPTIGIEKDSLTLNYSGKVAGKSVTRKEPFAIAKDLGKIRPLLQAVISVANGALKGTDFTAPLKFSDEKLEAYFKASPLDKASYAYETLFANPKFVEKLDELNEEISKTFEDAGLAPHEIGAVSHDKDSGRTTYVPQTAVDKLRKSLKAQTSPKPPGDDQQSK